MRVKLRAQLGVYVRFKERFRVKVYVTDYVKVEVTDKK